MINWDYTASKFPNILNIYNIADEFENGLIDLLHYISKWITSKVKNKIKSIIAMLT